MAQLAIIVVPLSLQNHGPGPGDCAPEEKAADLPTLLKGYMAGDILVISLRVEESKVTFEGTTMTSLERKAGFILGGIAAAEGTWVYVNVAGGPARLWRYTGFSNPLAAGFLGWALALAVSSVFIWGAARRLPSVRENLLRPSALKIIAVMVAVGAGLCEEAIFRKWLMDAVHNHNIGLTIQILTSALAFGLVHAIWGLFHGSIRASVGAASATGVLGFMLALVYIASHRILAPCVVSHFLINLFIEPGLVLAAVKGEMATAKT